MRNMEQFKNNLEGHFSQAFIKKALEYFKELEEEMELQEMETIKEVIQYYDKTGSYTCNILQSEDNLKELRDDIKYLYDIWGGDVTDLKLYFSNIEIFEIHIIYILYYNFYPREEEEEENI